MKTPFSLLTENEKNAFIDYINNNAEMETTCTAKTLLREWNEQKAHIFKLFGEQLILKTDVEFTQSKEAVALDIDNAWHNMPEEARRFTDNYLDFLTNQKGNIWEEYRKIQRDNPEMVYNFEENKIRVWYHLEDILSSTTLANNSIEKEYIVPLPKPDGSVREYKVQKGTKPMRVLRQLIKSYGEEEVGSMADFNAFCVWHSQFLNTSSLKGKLCFSIHPLDFLTMSDNANDWISCMSWQDNGCYRSGTVEMMNSPYAVVVYLEASDRKFYMTKDFVWNSKKWRSLCLIAEPGVISVKSYPYFHKEITEFSVKYLADLDAKNDYFAPTTFVPYRTEFIAEAQLMICPHTFRMYNDFSSTTHFIALKKVYGKGNYNFTFSYSGKSECMSCGALYDATDAQMFSSEENLCCMKCAGLDEDYVYCDECGEIIHVDDAYWIGDTPYCHECFSEVGFCDAITDEYHYNYDGTDIVFTFGNKSVEVGMVYLPSFVHLNVKEEYKNEIWNQANKDFTTIDANMLNDRGISEMNWYLKYRADIDLPSGFELAEYLKDYSLKEAI